MEHPVIYLQNITLKGQLYESQWDACAGWGIRFPLCLTLLRDLGLGAHFSWKVNNEAVVYCFL